mgnify:CR=1 FL=1
MTSDEHDASDDEHRVACGRQNRGRTEEVGPASDTRHVVRTGNEEVERPLESQRPEAGTENEPGAQSTTAVSE